MVTRMGRTFQDFLKMLLDLLANTVLGDLEIIRSRAASRDERGVSIMSSNGAKCIR